MHHFGFSLHLYPALAIASIYGWVWVLIHRDLLHQTFKVSLVLPMSEWFSRCIPISAPFWMVSESWRSPSVLANANPLQQKWVRFNIENPFPMNSFKGQQSVNQSQSVDLRLAFLQMIVWITNTHTNLGKAGRILFCQNLPKEGLGPLFCVWCPPRPTIYVSRHWQVSAKL